MWFKQISIFNLSQTFSFNAEQLQEQLSALSFHDCLPSMTESNGWVAPVSDNESLVLAINDCYLICMNSEEKILPNIVVNQMLAKRISEYEDQSQKKIYQKEKMRIKDELILELLPRAFTKHTKTFAYFDKKHQWLLIGTTQLKKIEKFLYLLKKSCHLEASPLLQSDQTFDFNPFLHKDTPAFNVDPSYVLQDPQNVNREIRCKQQDIYDESIQELLQNYKVKQLALNWQDQVHFQLKHNGDLQSLRYCDELIHEVKDMQPETQAARISADFLIMSTTLRKLLLDLLEAGIKQTRDPSTLSKSRFLENEAATLN